MSFRTYKNDPRQMTTRFNFTCPKCKKPVKKGEPIIYWPADKTAQCAACGESDYRRFVASAQDEEVCNGRTY